ncbi:hypothetical protein CPAST_c17900 [Clostridium pasteurianum DSM 525 = ATCC 6013]|uniref:Uncharacterized protein n=2 Tax=Clostridium pasteurianum TaxID=1501 RepID=A0A0H3J9N5_CLOPA|nr:hypothetical protein CPAST_c17900 [Clostridium pasteurianum DSM 525 = ATCC 6013]AJA51848.1 hypothetical protein CLPA_c17900 [Clostridium pasteurianum DSM 525 = ATCC 6013]KRU12144.1 hypothetical protein CP6013_01391 [Clostridium pasteurianum DSM 525 = ATCC 6013]
MREIAEQANQDSLSAEDIEILNDSINNLAAQVRAIDSEIRKMEDHDAYADLLQNVFDMIEI